MNRGYQFLGVYVFADYLRPCGGLKSWLCILRLGMRLRFVKHNQRSVAYRKSNPVVTFPGMLRA
jgi:hypothetical protein